MVQSFGSGKMFVRFRNLLLQVHIQSAGRKLRIRLPDHPDISKHLLLVLKHLLCLRNGHAPSCLNQPQHQLFLMRCISFYCIQRLLQHVITLDKHHFDIRMRFLNLDMKLLKTVAGMNCINQTKHT